jgi:membrane-bound lytic murein transglycosylase D
MLNNSLGWLAALMLAFCALNPLAYAQSAPTESPALIIEKSLDQEKAPASADALAPLLLETNLPASVDASAPEPVVEVVAEPAFPQNIPTDIPAFVPPVEMPGVVQPDLWQRIRANFRIADLKSPLTAKHENWYASRPDYFQRMTDRSARYLYYIVQEVEKRGMPSEIALLPMIESAYNPQAYSRSHAAGMWQFIPSTGKQYGLEQNWWYDGRRDVLAGTRAALNYLSKLHNQFGSWELALAAYNCGEGTVGRAIAANAAQGLPTDLMSLSLPDEARNYVPKLLGVKKLIANPGHYGLALLHVPNQPYFTTLEMRKHIDVQLAAEFALMTVNDFTALNPGYNQPVITHHGARIVLPVDRVDNFVAQLAQYTQPLVSWQSYQAQHGQSLDDIAKRFNTTASNLRSNNPVDEKRNKLVGAHTLLVPMNNRNNIQRVVATVPASVPALASVQAAAISVIETPSAVILSNTAPVQDAIGQTPVQQNNYVVMQGDTLYGIGKRYSLSSAEIKAINMLESDALKPGQSLVLPAAANAAPLPVAAVAAVSETSAAKNRQAIYKVQHGDTLYAIAKQFSVAIADLARWNNFNPSHTLQPGIVMKVAGAN